jgi:hypothetical protein
MLEHQFIQVLGINGRFLLSLINGLSLCILHALNAAAMRLIYLAVDAFIESPIQMLQYRKREAIT